MMPGTQPHYAQWFAVVWVVGLAFLFAADGARLSDKNSVFYGSQDRMACAVTPNITVVPRNSPLLVVCPFFVRVSFPPCSFGHLNLFDVRSPVFNPHFFRASLARILVSINGRAIPIELGYEFLSPAMATNLVFS